MEGISRTPLENSVAFLQLRDRYKSSLLEDSRLTKAAGLAAQQELLLNSNADASWKVPRLKALSKELRVWSQKIRQPGQSSHPDSPEEGDESNLAVGPTQQFMGNITKLKKRINRPAATPPIGHYKPSGTSKLKQKIKSEPTKKATSKKVTSKSKKQTKEDWWVGLPDVSLTGKQSTASPEEAYASLGASYSPKKEQIYESDPDFESATDEPPSTPLTGKQIAHSLIKSARTKAVQAAKSRARELALKRLQRQPGWKHFGAPPLRRKLHGTDWSASPKKKT